MPGDEVWLKVYDLSDGKAAAVSPLLLKKPIRGIWHSSVEVYGFEYFYGGYIERMNPALVEREIGMTPDITKLLGTTTMSRKTFEKFLSDIDHDFTPETYDLVEWNCNHFADVCARFLMDGKGVPKSLLCQPGEVSKSVVGKAILRLIEIAHDNPVQMADGQLRTDITGSCEHHRISYRPLELQEKVRLKRQKKNTNGALSSMAGALIQAGLLQRPIEINWHAWWPFNTCTQVNVAEDPNEVEYNVVPIEPKEKRHRHKRRSKKHESIKHQSKKYESKG
ncbi:putative PPPDE peptidase domain protein [Gregarina niphandrodes]|uniref:PPPDE peptidase domain protein n=1 Tax=Gregarina niphandrodes TaxID=110365 RepID=A0A023B407_GRENI|nr:putative PPPDE peptidase domain protein [Gregarina niphandrodes]EZG56153.1 putative PPPDE peptidase domain protein [Gregarina niphandrodes]|eukprot:XP_011131326.1 putative PPPDE peptidase domain protein [Gregarina niphandrodes]